MRNVVVISGCSGGGKSSLIDEMRRRGYGVIEEPGRRIIAEERRRGGRALPWIDGKAFVRRAMELARQDLARVAGSTGWVFCDRGLVDAAAGLCVATGEPISRYLGDEPVYHQLVFLTPPWPEIYVNDSDRRHSLAQAMDEYKRLLKVYPLAGYQVIVLPRVDVAHRADFVLSALARGGATAPEPD